MVERIDQIEKKLDGLAASVERRFEAVDAAFLEQRQYTEFAFSKLEGKMDARFDGMDARFDRMDARFGGIDTRFDRMDARFGGIDTRFDRIDARFGGIDTRFDRIDARFDGIDARFDRLERTLGQFIKGFAAPKRGSRGPRKR